MNVIKSIRPNNDIEYIVGENCKAINITTKSGHMAEIQYYEVELNDGSFVEMITSDVIARYIKTNPSI
jgi:hypothetical protein